MSTAEDPTSSASGMAEQQAADSWAVRFVRATPRSAMCGCITSRRARGRWSFCCTVFLSSGMAGGCRSRRLRRRDFGSLPLTCAATTCPPSLTASMPTTDKLTDDIRDLVHERGAESALLAGHDWGGTVAWDTAMSHPEVVERLAILNVAHPRKFLQGLHHPGQLRKSWYVFFFDIPELPETVVRANHWHFFRHFLRDARPAYTPEEMERYIEAWSQPGAAAGMINYYRNAARQSPKHVEAQIRPIPAPTLVIWGKTIATSARTWPSLTTTMCPAWIVSSACPAPHTGSTTTSTSASTSCSSTSSPPPCQPKNPAR